MSKRAIILAAGQGTRMGDLTEQLPKPLLKVGKYTIIEYIIQNLINCGIQEIGINLFHQGQKIEQYLGDGSRFNIKIYYHYEIELLGTAGSLLHFKDFLKDQDSFIVHYGDILTDQNLKELSFSKSDTQSISNIFLHHNPNSNSFIKLNHKTKLIEEFHERPKIKPQGDYYANSGIYLFKPNIFEQIKHFDLVQDFAKDIFPILLQKRQVLGTLINSKRIAIDNIQRLEKARKEISDFNFQV